MSQLTDAGTLNPGAAAISELGTQRPAYRAYQLLHWGFVAVPLIAGLDKYFHVLVDWDKYLAPWINHLLGGHGHTFMLAVGAVEIIAAIGVAIRPRLFAFVVCGWLVGIIVNLLTYSGFYDIALRDLGLAVGALALACLSQEFDGR